MTSVRDMSRFRAARISLFAAVGVAVCTGLVALLAKAAAWFDGEGLIGALIAVVSLLVMVALLSGSLVLLYGMYALIRGPRRRAPGPTSE